MRTATFLTFFLAVSWCRADDIEREPIRYDSAPTRNAITRLEERMKKNAKPLEQDDSRSFLRALLKELKVPESSQTLVFSRTSLQRQKISPDRPRAIYFGDDIYVGACQNSDLFEISAVDPGLGVVFYSTEFRPGKPPAFTRHNDACMSCHGSSATGGYPGHMIRSVFPDADGFPLLTLGTFRVDQRTPIKHRWGGWYVTGQTGAQSHLGNRVFKGEDDRDVVDPRALNRDSIADRIDVPRYLNGHSDVVALMVMEHQAQMQNLITQASLQTRISLYQDRQLNKELKQPADTISATTWRRISNAGDQIVKYMVFSEEAPLAAPIKGSSKFAWDFAAAGRHDERGRSLRELDLKTRVFKYPCSYLIDSEQFDAMPSEMKDYVLRRLYEVLIGRDTRPAFEHLTAEDRQATLEILRATMPNLPSYWRE